MAKEPKLLAEIRKARERAEKAAAHAPPVPVGPIMTATVETPAVRQRPNNYIVGALDECTTVAQCQELLDHAKQHGYADDGQTVQLIRGRIEELRRGDRKATPKKTPKRGGRR